MTPADAGIPTTSPAGTRDPGPADDPVDPGPPGDPGDPGPAGDPGRDVVLRVETFTSPAARRLIAGSDAFTASVYGHADETPLEPEQFDRDRGGVFLVAYLGEAAVGCGGFRRAAPPAPEDAAEVKRMFVADHARRRGVAGRLLAALEVAARAEGYRQVVLDVGDRQEAALAFYETRGYHRIPGFSIYRDAPGNRAYGKLLDPS